MKKIFVWNRLWLVVVLGFWGLKATAQSSIPLAGTWELQLDPDDQGLRTHLWSRPFNDRVRLPGSLADNRKGNPVTVDTRWTGDIFDSTYFVSPRYAPYRGKDPKFPFWLKPATYYAGVAWYRREVEVPDNWAKTRVTLHLERCHWQTSVYVNGQFCGTQNSLVTAHDYDVSDYLQAGKNTICVRVDNRTQLHIGPNSHSIADHTQGNWNGLVGDLSLRSQALQTVEQVQIYPDVSKSQIRVKVRLQQPRNQVFKGKIALAVTRLGGVAETLASTEQAVSFDSETTVAELLLRIPNAALWDEFSPNLYQLTTRLAGENGQPLDEHQDNFGMRTVGVEGTRITVNSRPVFLRGDVDCAAFPLTGYPPTTAPYWEKIFKTLKNYGLNHLRFHSWCPPEVAFDVADREGIYLYVESPLWANQSSAVGTGGQIDDFIYRESERILAAYGNHPSFCFMSYGNEPDGKHQNAFFARWIEHFKAADNRHLYTSAAGWPMIPENQFHIDYNARIQRWGEGNNSIINKEKPATNYDWRDRTHDSKIPYVSHEIGQWCVYPNFREMAKYTGVMRPTNFEIFKATLEANAMGDQADDFLFASGRLQTLCYKADIEAALRTPGFGGFQLLGLYDFPGQGTALVGALDAFYEEKGYTTGDEYRQFCGPTVPLVRLPKLLYKNTETLTGTIEIAHFGPQALNNQKVVWQLTDASGKVYQRGEQVATSIGWGNVPLAGGIAAPLKGIAKAQKLLLTVSLPGTSAKNQWEIWVYPSSLPANPAKGRVVVTERLTDEVVQQLKNGASVLWLPYGQVKKGQGAEVQIGFSSVFWNTAWTGNQAPHTLGLLCNPAHPLFSEFPTEKSSNYQWFDVVSQSQAIVLDNFPAALRPLVQPIDTWFENRRLSLVFEAKVGKGKIVVCSADLSSNLEERLGARQLRYSLLKYAASAAFNPAVEVRVEDLKKIVE